MGQHTVYAVAVSVLLGLSLSGDAAAANSRVTRIVTLSVQNNEKNWAAAPRYTYTEQDVISEHGETRHRTYQVSMIEGSPYNRLIAVDGKPLSPSQAAAEERKLQDEERKRSGESPQARRQRIEQYQRGRRQDHALMQEMMRAFEFTLQGVENVNGHQCFVLTATPKSAYKPTSRETKVLTGMRGKMWVDVNQYQWVKVQAEVFRPVSFGLFVAHVQPGTEFTLEEEPVGGGIWEPRHFVTRVNAKVLFWARRSIDDETYTDYRLAQSGVQPPRPPAD